MKRKIISAFICFMIITLFSCSLFQSETDTVVDLLPRDSDVPGWVRIDSFVNYKGKDVKMYGREYDGIGIDTIASCAYQSIDDHDIKIKLEVIKFNSVLDAYGFFSVKRGPGIFEVSEKNEFHDNAISVINAGEYVFYSSTDQTGLLLKKDLKNFSNISLNYIGQNYNHDKLPASLNVLKGVDGYGVLFSRNPYYKFPSIRKIYFTQWSWNSELINVFFSEYGSFYDAYEIYKKSVDNRYIMLSSDNTYTAFKKETDEKYNFISVNDKIIFGCWSVTDFKEGKKILNEIKTRIEDYKKKL